MNTENTVTTNCQHCEATKAGKMSACPFHFDTPAPIVIPGPECVARLETFRKLLVILLRETHFEIGASTEVPGLIEIRDNRRVDNPSYPCVAHFSEASLLGVYHLAGGRHVPGLDLSDVSPQDPENHEALRAAKAAGIDW